MAAAKTNPSTGHTTTKAFVGPCLSLARNLLRLGWHATCYVPFGTQIADANWHRTCSKEVAFAREVGTELAPTWGNISAFRRSLRLRLGPLWANLGA